jgi:hypothetical protein
MPNEHAEPFAATAADREGIELLTDVRPDAHAQAQPVVPGHASVWD